MPDIASHLRIDNRFSFLSVFILCYDMKQFLYETNSDMKQFLCSWQDPN